MAVDKETLGLVRDSLAKGKKKDEILGYLKEAGASDADANEIIASAEKEISAAPSKMKKGRRHGAIAIFLILVFLAFFLFFPNAPQYAPEELNNAYESVRIIGTQMDCGSNYSCFVEAASNCTPVKLSQTQNYVTYSLQVRRGTAEACNFMYKISSVDFPAGMRSQTSRALASKLSGASMFCNAPASVNVLESKKNVELYCSGGLKDLMLGEEADFFKSIFA
jgi:hypothetical protein